MATIASAQSTVLGTVLTPVAATAGPDKVLPDSRGIVIVHNASGSAITVTIVDPGVTKYGGANPDPVSVSIPAGAHASLGPFPTDLANVGDSGLVYLTASSATSVTFYGVKA